MKLCENCGEKKCMKLECICEFRRRTLLQAVGQTFSGSRKNKNIDWFTVLNDMVRFRGLKNELSNKLGTKPTCKRTMEKIVDFFHDLVPIYQIDDQLKIMYKEDGYAYPLISGEIDEILHNIMTGEESCAVCDIDD